ncbi:hypothetical protein [Polluticaenibacter yanchengensis]|uniref:Uncharacterized protein n=1 Tax=Polluticaenibacter yanchengensis TaxID=3014562 RepID=A0ABT4UKS3_9BACT|nr:hypothetical protein [Chitinophagaceae bacterium LY-5]
MTKKTTFRMKESDTIKAMLYNRSGKLLTSIYDSGFSRIEQVRSALKSKCCHPPKGTKISILNQTKDQYWSE